MTAVSYEVSHLRALEAEAIHVMREVAAEVERAVLLFSGGKDSIVLLRLAEKAFHPAKFPFAVMHVDTGHNFPEVLEFRDRRMDELGARLIVASVQDAIDAGKVVEETGPPHDRHFVIAARVKGREVGRGEGRTKKTAEQEAAAQGLAEFDGGGD